MEDRKIDIEDRAYDGMGKTERNKGIGRPEMYLVDETGAVKPQVPGRQKYLNEAQEQFGYLNSYIKRFHDGEKVDELRTALQSFRGRNFSFRELSDLYRNFRDGKELWKTQGLRSGATPRSLYSAKLGRKT